MRSLVAPLLFSLFLATSGAAQPTCTVVSWNIRYDNPSDSLDRWDLRRDALAREVTRQRPQLIGLQEVLANQAEYLDAKWPGFKRFGVGRDDGVAKGEFSPIYYDTTAFSVVEGRTVWLSPTPDVPSKGWDAECVRIATYLVLFDLRTHDTVFVVNTHWDHVGVEARKNSARMLEELLAPLLKRHCHILLMGDFNSSTKSPEVATIARIVQDAAPAQSRGMGTFNGFNLVSVAFERIDYVWHSPLNWELLRYEVPHPMTSGRYVSDHFPVVVGLRAR